MDKHLAYYVVSYFGRLMNAQERAAYLHLTTTMKATGLRDDIVAQEEAKNSKIHSRWLSTDPEVLRLASGGYQAFLANTAKDSHRTPRSSVSKSLPAMWHTGQDSRGPSVSRLQT